MNTTLSPMDPQRRAAVREMLVAHATAPEPNRAEPPVGSRTRSYRPLTAVVALGAAVTVTAVAVVAVDPAAPPTYASWTAVPATAPGAAVSDEDAEYWASRCSDLGVAGVTIEGVPGDQQAAALRQPLVDRRGDFTFCVDVAPGSGTASDPLVVLSGIRADEGPLEDLNTMWGRVDDTPYTPPTGDAVDVLTGDLRVQPELPEDDDYTTLEVYQLAGMAGPDVQSIDIILTNGQRISATVQNGVWGAWWPVTEGDPEGSELHVKTTTGSRVVNPDAALV